MKRILAPILLLTLLFPSLAFGEYWSDLEERDGIYYKKFSTVPFTGKTTDSYLGSFKDGIRVGPWVAYYKDGTVWDYLTGTYKDGVKVK
jgi:hypothetical protein